MATPTDRRRLPAGLAGLAGLACVACCALPVMLAGGVLGGAAWALLGRLLPALAVAAAAVAALAWWWPRRRAHQPGCAGTACTCAEPPH